MKNSISDPACPTIAGVILAAGLSTRMGSTLSKVLLPLGNSTILSHIVATAEKTTLNPIVVVTGHQASLVETAVNPQRARFSFNAGYKEGNLESLRAGCKALGTVDAVMLLLGDMPEIEVSAIEMMCDTWRQSQPFAAVASYRGDVGHPFVLSAEAISMVTALTGAKPIWRWLLEEHRSKVIEIPLDQSKPRDVNTSSDYATVLNSICPAKDSET